MPTSTSSTSASSTREEPPYQPDWLLAYVNTYNELHAGNLDRLAEIYQQNITFVDPVHKIEGLSQLQDYFNNLYLNMNQCQFVITNTVANGHQAAIYWTMTFSHKKIKSGQDVVVEGHSLLKETDGKVIYQRDYFDVSSMVYEHVPIIGSIIKAIKSRIG